MNNPITVIKSWMQRPFWDKSMLTWAGLSSKAGVPVSNTNALTSTAYYAGVTLIAQTLAQLPLLLYERLEPRGKRRATEHQLYSLLHDEANPYMSAYAWKETAQGHVLTWGNHYSEIDWDMTAGVPRGLYPLRPDQMRVEWEEGKLVYKYRLPDGTGVKLRPDQVLHIPGFGFDGVIGYDPITLAREAIGLAKATEEFGSRFFSGGSTLSGVIEHPGKPSDEAKQHMRESWQEQHSGLSNTHRITILEEGVTFKSIGIPPENAQFLETRKFQIAEIARFLHVPPHMLGDLERSTYSNIEHQGIEFIVYTMGPWLVRWEQEIRRKLLSLADKQKYFAEFLVTGLLRGDTPSRFQAYATARQWGWLSANDIRELENMNPVGGGDDYLMPMNMMPVGMAALALEEPQEQTLGMKAQKDAAGKRMAILRSRVADSHKPLFAAAAQNIVKAEVRNIRKAAKAHLDSKSAQTFGDWLEGFYAKFADTVGKEIEGCVRALAEAITPIAGGEVGGATELTPEMEKFLSEYVAAFTARYIESHKGQLGALSEEEDFYSAVDNRLNDWEEKQPGKVAMNETGQLANAIAKLVFVGAGVTVLKWQAIGSESCPLCQEMDGRVVGVDEAFLPTNGVLHADGANAIRAYRPTTHPPLHQGCVCAIVPG